MRFVENDATRLSLQLRDIAQQSQGLSGRTLRKLPFLAHALYGQVYYSNSSIYCNDSFLCREELCL